MNSADLPRHGSCCTTVAKVLFIYSSSSESAVRHHNWFDCAMWRLNNYKVMEVYPIKGGHNSSKQKLGMKDLSLAFVQEVECLCLKYRAARRCAGRPPYISHIYIWGQFWAASARVKAIIILWRSLPKMTIRMSKGESA